MDLWTLILIVNLALALSLQSDDPNLIIELPFGKLRGKEGTNYYSYESIPYAEPPVGALRFENPKPYSQKWEGIFDATRPAPICMQWDQIVVEGDKLRGVEDCLTVDIYKPKTKHGKPLPVLVYIHGGAFMFGGTSEMGYEYLMNDGQVILAKLTYRLGPLGFLSTEDDVITGNFGLKDQRLGLQWVKKYISEFGGDPENIMLFGFSAGAASTHLHLLNPDLSNYAKVAASFSGVALDPWVITHNARELALELGQRVGCSAEQSVEALKACLKQKPAEEIVRDVRNFFIFGYSPFTIFGPVVENHTAPDAFLTREPEELLREGHFARIPWLTTFAAQDGGYDAAELLTKNAQGVEWITIYNDRWTELAPRALFFNTDEMTAEQMKDRALSLRKRYLGNQSFSVDSYLDVERMYTDVLFKEGAEKSVRLQRAHADSAPIYTYVYDNPSVAGLGAFLARRNDIKFGTVHSDDFYLIIRTELRAHILRPDEKLISRKLIKMLHNFVVSGKAVYGQCDLVNNVGRSDLELLHITRHACENMCVKTFL